MNPRTINSGIKINELKIRDVNNLLMKDFGDNWKDLNNLEFCKNIIHSDQVLTLNKEPHPICEWISNGLLM